MAAASSMRHAFEDLHVGRHAVRIDDDVEHDHALDLGLQRVVRIARRHVHEPLWRLDVAADLHDVARRHRGHVRRIPDIGRIEPNVVCRATTSK